MNVMLDGRETPIGWVLAALLFDLALVVVASLVLRSLA